jgi:hypothetical protein
MSARRGGRPSQQTFIVVTPILAETASKVKVAINSINYPTYLRAPSSNRSANLRDAVYVYMYPKTLDAGVLPVVNISVPLTVSSVDGFPLPNSDSIIGSGSNIVPGGAVEIYKSMLGFDFDYAFFYDNVLNPIVNYLYYVFEPVHHDFTIDIMSSHIQLLSLLLFLLTVLILIFFISLLFNITLFIFSDSLISYFKNKYIILYLKFNKKIIATEILILSG